MTKSIRGIIALSILLLFQSFTPDQYKLLLNSGSYNLPEGHVEQSLSGKSLNGYYHRIMQFYATPTQRQKELMQDMGIQFFGYLPKHAFLVAIPKKLPVTKLAQFNVRSIVEMTPEMKYSRAIATNEIPTWSKIPGGNFAIIVGFYPTMNSANIAQIMNTLGISYEDYPAKNHIRAFVTQAQIELLAQQEAVYYLQENDDVGEPENNRARSDHRVNAIQGNYNGGIYYDGTGVIVAVGDDGDISDHIDYRGRLTSHAGPSNGDHGDHVSGTVFGAGNRDPKGKGMAPGATIEYFDYFSGGNIYLWEADTMYDQLGVRITQSSYSNGSNSYTSLTREMDKQVHEKRSLMHVFSSGNAGSNWSTITGGHKQAKNVIATGNVQYNDLIASSSSRGPAHDGRVKPDVCAVGTQVYSTTDLTSTGYTTKTGTSMASPGASGTLSLLYQAYKENNNQMEPDGGLMKAVMMNSAEDLGNKGPDYIYGYGRLNALRAVQTIENDYIFIDSMTQGQTDSMQITVGADIAELRVMVYWSDPEALANTNRAIVNDLNFTLYNASGSTSWKPWVLNPNSPGSAAVRATDSLNNVEQVTIDNPAVGDYKVVVNGNSIPTGPQRYYVVYSLVPNEIKVTHPIGGEHFVPGVQEVIRWDAPAGTSSFTLEYSTNNGQSYSTIATVSGSQRYYNWSVPNTVTGEGLVRVSRSGKNSVSEANFSIIGVPQNINVVWACPDSLLLSWNPVTSATGYQIHQLGSKYMDSVGTSTTTSFIVKNYNPSKTTWFSVRALGNNGCVGRRAVAIEKQPGTFGCNIAQDAGLVDLSPTILPSCQGASSIPVTIEIKNTGQQNISNIPVAYQFNNSTTVVRDTVFDTITPGSQLKFTFATTLSVATAGTYPFLAFAEMAADQNSYNDTIIESFTMYSSSSTNLPYQESFDSFANCGTQNNCEATICNVINGWKNLDNLVQDDIDFRTISGTTASSNTGPSGDHTSGSGKYLYTEASGGCDDKTALLITPCFDLTGVNAPQASIWYHMLGASMGELHIDILVDGEWIEDVVPSISGNQGASWQQVVINLNTYIGKTINLRFRGITGNGFTSDICLDDFEIKDAVGVPTAEFSASETSTCVNTPITLTDQSLQGPTSWNWSITPSTFNFVGGTSATSQNPEVTFTAIGLYSVQLIATNQYGADTVLKTNYISINNGNSLPIQQDFQGLFPPSDWTIINPDADYTWEKSNQITGSNGNATYAAFMNNFNYDVNYEEDIMQLPKLNLYSVNNAYLTFDVAYAQYSSTFSDGLRIEISTDCGLTYTDTIYHKEGTVLATVPNQTSYFTPGSASHWRKDSVSLAPYGGNTVSLRFISMSRYGNSLYVDNINILQAGVQAPVAAFTISSNASCVGDTVEFTSTSTGSVTAYDWNFGAGATPATANTVGPHKVVYSTQGNKTVMLQVTNSGGSNNTSNQLMINDEPVAGFTAVNSDTLSVKFTDLSSNNPTAWAWQFGDGNTSIVQNPTHVYAAGGTYNVTLTATNACGSNDSTFSVYVSGIGIDEISLANAIQLVPNPASNMVKLTINHEHNVAFLVELLDVTGKRLNTLDWNTVNEREKSIDVSMLPNGVYLVRLAGSEGSLTKRLVIRK